MSNSQTSNHHPHNAVVNFRLSNMVGA